MNVVGAILLGFKFESGKFSQSDIIAPIGWEGLEQPLDFSNLSDRIIEEKMHSDLKKNDESIG